MKGPVFRTRFFTSPKNRTIEEGEQVKEKVYRWLTRRIPGAMEGYEQLRLGGTSRKKAWPALAGMALREWWSGERPALGSRKRLPEGGSESLLTRRESPEEFARKLARCQEVTLDVFDTLILRRVDRPDTVFSLMGMKLRYPDFRRLRVEGERMAREKKRREQGTGEVTLEEIWQQVSLLTGLPSQEGIRTELETERAVCRGNPYFLRVVRELERLGKQPLLLSDMYLPASFLEDLLRDCGYGALGPCLVSGEEGVSKGDGGLYRLARKKLGEGKTLAHVGDHPLSDGEQAKAQGWEPFLYENVHRAGRPYRGEDLSPVVGSLYRGIVNGKLHNGLECCSPLYEYGFVYGGLFALGYCRFIRSYAQSHSVDRLLFLSRDGALLFRLYRRLYPEDSRPRYAYWSRLAGGKVTAQYFPADFFRRFVYHRANGTRSLEEIFTTMDLGDLLPGLCRKLGQEPSAPLTHKNAGQVQDYLTEVWELVLACYRGQQEGARIYYRQLLEGSRRAAAVDIGWAGSGGISLSWAVEKLWQLPCRVTGLVAGTNSLHSPEWDGVEPLLLSGDLVSYLYSSGDNRDLWKFHDPRGDHNLFWELLLGSEEGSLRGMYPGGPKGYRMEFSENPHPEAVREIHRGAMDFAEAYLETERRLGVTLPISGRDAYGPLLEVLAPENAPYRRRLEAYLDEPNIG